MVRSTVASVPEGGDQLGVALSNLLQSLLDGVPEGPQRELDLLDVMKQTLLQGGAELLQTGERGRSQGGRSGRISEKINRCFHLLSSSVVNDHI